MTVYICSVFTLLHFRFYVASAGLTGSGTQPLARSARSFSGFACID